MTTASEIVVPHLAGALDVPVVFKVPRNRPHTFVRVDQGAPRRINLVQLQATVIVQAYAPTMSKAVGLAEDCYRCLEMLDHLDVVSGWGGQSGPYEFPDPDIACHRWQTTGELIYTPDLS